MLRTRSIFYLTIIMSLLVNGLKKYLRKIMRKINCGMENLLGYISENMSPCTKVPSRNKIAMTLLYLESFTRLMMCTISFHPRTSELFRITMES